MALPAKITSNSKDYVLYEAPASGLNSRAVYRYEDATVAPMYRSSIDLRAVPNSRQTNHTVHVGVKMPIVTNDNGIQEAKDTIQLRITYTALQNVVSPLSGEAVDTAIAALTALKANIVAGKAN